MKLNKSIIFAFILLIVFSSLYRVWQDRPFGFVPHIAIAIFGGAVLKNKWQALLMTLGAIFISDVIYEILWWNALSPIPGFYEGQITNYALVAGLTLFGSLMGKITALRVTGFSISGSILFFIVSNFFVWLSFSGLKRPLTFEGLMLCYGDALAFYRDYGLFQGFYGNMIIGDLFFSLLIFGLYATGVKYVARPALQTSN